MAQLKVLSMVWARIDPGGPGLHLPKLAGDTGYDLESAEDVLLGYNEQRDISTNVRVQLPEGCWGEIRARSSIARLGLQAEPCVIDNGYTGELLVLLRNTNSANRARVESEARDWTGRVRIRKGQRIAQLVLHQGVRVQTTEVSQLRDDPRRGSAGFGSTGTGLIC